MCEVMTVSILAMNLKPWYPRRGRIPIVPPRVAGARQSRGRL